MKKKSLILFDRNAKTEVFKRPDHNDFATSAELKQREFTGSRHNSLTDCIELWILGECKVMITKEDRNRDPKAVIKAHVELFQLLPDMIQNENP